MRSIYEAVTVKGLGKVHIVPDIETYSTTPNAMIIAIGAIAIYEGQTIGQFYQNIDPTNFEDLGFEASTSTIDWWNHPDRDAARNDLQDDQIDLKQALQKFQRWVEDCNGNHIWGYGSDFDVVILKNAFDKFGLEWPFKFYNHRCLRTMCATLDIQVDRKVGVHHNALADAINQGKALVDCHKHILGLTMSQQSMKNLNDRNW